MRQLNPLTGLRGVAAYSVLTAHAISTAFLFSGVNPLDTFSRRLAYFGMSLFFVLSGFVIHYNYAKLIQSDGLISGGYQFISARIARLYPLYGLIFLFTLDCLPSTIFHNKQWEELSYLTMTQSWLDLQDLIFPPAWSISTEWFFYFAFLIMLPLLSFVERIRRPFLVLGIFLISTFLLMPSYLKFQININEKMHLTSALWIIYYSPYTRIFDFIGGMLASMAFLSLEDKKNKMKFRYFLTMLGCVVWCIIIVAFGLTNYKKLSHLLTNFIFTPAIAPLLILLCHYESFLSRILCSRPLIFMGEISYSVYLLGFTIMTGVAAVYINPKPTPMAYVNSSIKVIVIITLTTFIAYGCYYLFEKPMRDWVRNRLLPKRKKQHIEVIPEKIICEIK